MLFGHKWEKGAERGSHHEVRRKNGIINHLKVYFNLQKLQYMTPNITDITAAYCHRISDQSVFVKVLYVLWTMDFSHWSLPDPDRSTVPFK